MQTPLRRAHVLLLLTVTVLLAACSNRGLFGGGKAGATIERHGAAITKPIPNVAVFVPRRSADGREKFGDEQLRAIVPAMKDLNRFNELDLGYSSITDAGIHHLRTLSELEELHVHETAVTVNGLTELRHLPKLRLIVISRGQYADDDLATLKREFPKATIHEAGHPTTAPIRSAAM